MLNVSNLIHNITILSLHISYARLHIFLLTHMKLFQWKVWICWFWITKCFRFDITLLPSSNWTIWSLNFKVKTSNKSCRYLETLYTNKRTKLIFIVNYFISCGIEWQPPALVVPHTVFSWTLIVCSTCQNFLVFFQAEILLCCLFYSVYLWHYQWACDSLMQ